MTKTLLSMDLFWAFCTCKKLAFSIVYFQGAGFRREEYIKYCTLAKTGFMVPCGD